MTPNYPNLTLTSTSPKLNLHSPLPWPQPPLHHLHRLHQFAYLEDDDPGVGNVVKVDGPLVRVAVSSLAARVVLVPVNAQPGVAVGAVGDGGRRVGAEAQRAAVQRVLLVQAAGASALPPLRHVGARHDAVVHGQRADEGPLVVFVRHVVGPGETHARAAVDEGDGVGGWGEGGGEAKF